MFKFQSLGGPCEKCGTAYIAFADGFSMGVTCPHCGWGFATTNPQAIEVSQRPIPCPICNNKITGRFVNCELVFSCEHCDFTTYTNGIPAILQDSKLYELTIVGTNSINKKQIRLLSEITKKGFSDVYKDILQGKEFHFPLRSEEAFYISKLFDFVEIKYEITPDFKYTPETLFSTEEVI